MAKEKAAPKPKGRLPDYDIAVLHRSTNQKGRAGAAWKGTNGAISIVLNPGVQLNSVDWVITLFPKSGKGVRSADLDTPF